MALGSDNTICKNELIEAMRARLTADDPATAAGVDREDVRKNFSALGEAVYRIVTVRADTVSDSASDAAFWQWIADAQAWLEALAAWQQGVAEAFAAWTPTQAAEQTLKAAVKALPSPGTPPAGAPATAKGRIE